LTGLGITFGVVFAMVVATKLISDNYLVFYTLLE